ncbi:MAG: SMC-Scp complex subunit ScpB [Ginsengibacter sp.]
MELSIIIPHIEALIFASDKPLSADELVELINNALGFIEDRASAEQVEASIKAIEEKYSSEFYSFEIVESGGGWQFLTKKEYHKTIAQLSGDKFLKKLSVASLETLSIIAYKQPVTKSDIEIIRGVNCDYAVQKLLEKELVVIAGRKEDAPGKPLIYTTSKSFMDYFGINSPDDLPKIQEVLNQEIIEATKIENAEKEQFADDKEELEIPTDVNAEEVNVKEMNSAEELDIIADEDPEADQHPDGEEEPAKQISE